MLDDIAAALADSTGRGGVSGNITLSVASRTVSATATMAAASYNPAVFVAAWAAALSVNASQVSTTASTASRRRLSQQGAQGTLEVQVVVTGLASAAAASAVAGGITAAAASGSLGGAAIALSAPPSVAAVIACTISVTAGAAQQSAASLAAAVSSGALASSLASALGLPLSAVTVATPTLIGPAAPPPAAPAGTALLASAAAAPAASRSTAAPLLSPALAGTVAAVGTVGCLLAAAIVWRQQLLRGSCKVAAADENAATIGSAKGCAAVQEKPEEEEEEPLPSFLALLPHLSLNRIAPRVSRQSGSSVAAVLQRSSGSMQTGPPALLADLTTPGAEADEPPLLTGVHMRRASITRAGRRRMSYTVVDVAQSGADNATAAAAEQPQQQRRRSSLLAVAIPSEASEEAPRLSIRVGGGGRRISSCGIISPPPTAR